MESPPRSGAMRPKKNGKILESKPDAALPNFVTALCKHDMCFFMRVNCMLLPRQSLRSVLQGPVGPTAAVAGSFVHPAHVCQQPLVVAACPAQPCVQRARDGPQPLLSNSARVRAPVPRPTSHGQHLSTAGPSPAILLRPSGVMKSIMLSHGGIVTLSIALKTLMGTVR